MPRNGMSADLEFEERIRDWPDEAQFLAREIRRVRHTCEERNSCGPVILSRRQVVGGVGVVGGTSALVTLIAQVILRLAGG